MYNIKVLCKVVSGDNIYKVLSPKKLVLSFLLISKFYQNVQNFRVRQYSLYEFATFGSLREENLVLIVTVTIVCTIFAISRIYLNQ